MAVIKWDPSDKKVNKARVECFLLNASIEEELIDAMYTFVSKANMEVGSEGTYLKNSTVLFFSPE